MPAIIPLSIAHLGLHFGPLHRAHLGFVVVDPTDAELTIEGQGRARLIIEPTGKASAMSVSTGSATLQTEKP